MILTVFVTFVLVSKRHPKLLQGWT